MRYRAFDIDYDTDGQTIYGLYGLPNELIVELDDSVSPEQELADAISNETGWCVNGFNFEALAPETTPTAP